MYIGPKTPRGTNKNTIRVPDLLTKVFLKALAGNPLLQVRVFQHNSQNDAVIRYHICHVAISGKGQRNAAQMTIGKYLKCVNQQSTPHAMHMWRAHTK